MKMWIDNKIFKNSSYIYMTWIYQFRFWLNISNSFILEMGIELMISFLFLNTLTFRRIFYEWIHFFSLNQLIEAHWRGKNHWDIYNENTAVSHTMFELCTVKPSINNSKSYCCPNSNVLLFDNIRLATTIFG